MPRKPKRSSRDSQPAAARAKRASLTQPVKPSPLPLSLRGRGDIEADSGGQWRIWAAGLVLIAAGVVVYANSLQGVFLFDDAYAIVENWRIRRIFPLSRLVATERPLVELSLAINYAIGQLKVAGYHVFNIAVHIAAGLTLFGLVRRTIGLRDPSRARQEAVSSGDSPSRFLTGAARKAVHEHDPIARREPMATPVVAARESGTPATGLAPCALSGALIAFAVALVWMVHPLQTESVTYIIQRAESLMGLFYLLTLYAFVRGVRSQRRWWLVASVAACAAAMGTKAVAVTLPVMVLLYDRCFVAGTFGQALRRRSPYYAALAATWSILFFCGIVQHVFAPATQRTALGFGFKGVSALEYAATQPQIILHYLRLSLWPQPLCLDYAWPVARQAADVIVPAAVLAALIGGTVWALRRRHWLGFVGAWFFVILMPTSSFIPVRDLAFEHRCYLPLAAVVTAVVAGAARGLREAASKFRLPSRTASIAGLAALVVVAAALGWRSAGRNADYTSALGMWHSVAALRPNNARAWVNIGVLLEQSGKVDQAIDAYRKALALDANYSDAHFNLGVALLRTQRPAEAEAEFRETLRLSPDDPGAHVNLAMLITGRGELEEAAEHYRAALKTAPQDAAARARLANILRRLGKAADAAAEAQRAVEIAPQLPAAYEALAHSFLARGDMASAIGAFQRVVELDPANLSARINLGTSLKAEERFEEAVAVYREALRMDPNSAHAHFHFGDAHVKLGRYEEAIAELGIAVQLSPTDTEMRVGLAHALRLAGRRDEAIQHYQQALAINPNHREAQHWLSELTTASPESP